MIRESDMKGDRPRDVCGNMTEKHIEIEGNSPSIRVSPANGTPRRPGFAPICPSVDEGKEGPRGHIPEAG